MSRRWRRISAIVGGPRIVFRLPSVPNRLRSTVRNKRFDHAIRVSSTASDAITAISAV
jgi:hypothetical protein